jgi:hypothetical protein
MTKIKTVVLTKDNWTCPYCGVGRVYDVDYGPEPPGADMEYGVCQHDGLLGFGPDYRGVFRFFTLGTADSKVVPARTPMECHKCRWVGTAQQVVDQHVTRRSAYGCDPTERKPA